MSFHKNLISGKNLKGDSERIIGGNRERVLGEPPGKMVDDLLEVILERTFKVFL